MLDGVTILAVSCPKCMTMLEDAAKTSGASAGIAVREVIELVAEGMGLAEPEATTV